ncbi:hypothetical protein EMG21_33585, partial [Klebsiella pneumoniae]
MPAMNPSQIHLRDPLSWPTGWGRGSFFVPKSSTPRVSAPGPVSPLWVYHPDMTRASIYVRISYDPKDTRAGVHRQYEECVKLCERMGFEVGPLFEDNDLSATSGVARPAFEELLASNPEAIVAW